MYLWTLLHKSDNELAKRVFDTQKKFPNKNDWVLQVREDLEMCQLELTDEEIGAMKKEKFRQILNKKIHELSSNYLVKLVEKHSKTENLLPSDSIQNYLIDVNTTVEEKKLLFLLRSRMYSVKLNFQQSHSNLLCSLCSRSDES